ncbi:MAG: hypothetical protein H6835_19245 [Planctomycetes bacterium]|nr:hypothetical protein [Planctomycetota bacterium]
MDDMSSASDTSNTQSPSPQGVEAERNAELVKHWLENAQELRMRGQLQAAKMELLKARQVAPADDEVRLQLSAVQAELGEPAGTVTNIADEWMRRQQLAEERARATVQNQLQSAGQAIADKDYAGAVEELRRADLAIEIKSDMDWMGLPEQVASQKAEAERLYEEQQRQTQAEQNAQIAEQLRRDYARIQADKRARVDALIHQSQLAFDARQFDRAQDFAQRALDAEPSNAIAYEMRTISMKAARDASNEKFIKDRAREINKSLEADADLKIPQTETLRMDPVIWARANARAARTTGPKALDPQDAALSEKVNNTQVGRLTYTEETGAYLDVIKNLSLITGVQIITTPEAREIIDSESLVVVIELAASMSLRDFLNHMVGRSENLAWTVKNGVVVIGNKSQAAGTLITEIYPVKDLIFPLAEFNPPVIEGIPNEESGDEPRSGFEGDDKIIPIDIGQLSETLKKATGEEYWTTEGVDIRPEDSGLLSVTASPEMQQKIVKILGDMRRFQTPVVTIDSKFLTLSRNFLQEIGVDIRGLGGSGNKGDTVSLDDVTNGLVNNASRGADNGGTGDPAANPLAGAFFNDGSDGDVRARTENYFVTDLGRVLSPTGGLTAGWTLIDDTQLNLILRAVEKRQDSEVVNSQILSVMDRTRGHVAVINQTAYVRDFDVEVAQAAFIADPKVDVIQDGIVLDVKPIIQNDRKYIVLDLNPTVAELERPIPTFTTSLAGSTLPVTIQLPKLTVTRFRTTAKVPDGGSLLLGGLRQVLTKERRAEIPLMARLPLISILFKQEGSADENRSLMVMVRAQITDVVNDDPMR